jgi:hypothetical protein
MYPLSFHFRRETHGAIDYDYYRRRALMLRRARIRYAFRRRLVYHRGLYAAAVFVGLVVGITIPLGPSECRRNCGATLLDVPQGAEIDLLGAAVLQRPGMTAITARW